MSNHSLPSTMIAFAADRPVYPFQMLSVPRRLVSHPGGHVPRFEVDQAAPVTQIPYSQKSVALTGDEGFFAVHQTLPSELLQSSDLGGNDRAISCLNRTEMW